MKIGFDFLTNQLCRSDSADLVIQGTGKFEELMVWSHEISASTAQLVAASRVSFVVVFHCQIM